MGRRLEPHAHTHPVHLANAACSFAFRIVRNPKYLTVSPYSSLRRHINDKFKGVECSSLIESYLRSCFQSRMVSMKSTSPRILASLCLAFLFCSTATPAAGYLRDYSTPLLGLTVNPSSVVIKVGDQATINLTVNRVQSSDTVCFSEQGFPSSGFTLTFLPPCTSTGLGVVKAQLTVEATPAAAPQNFTALILAIQGNQTVSAPLTITVVPAIPAWIPWLGLLVFVLVMVVALFVKPRGSKGKGKMSDNVTRG